MINLFPYTIATVKNNTDDEQVAVFFAFVDRPRAEQRSSARRWYSVQAGSSFDWQTSDKHVLGWRSRNKGQLQSLQCWWQVSAEVNSYFRVLFFFVKLITNVCFLNCDSGRQLTWSSTIIRCRKSTFLGKTRRIKFRSPKCSRAPLKNAFWSLNRKPEFGVDSISRSPKCFTRPKVMPANSSPPRLNPEWTTFSLLKSSNADSRCTCSNGLRSLCFRCRHFSFHSWCGIAVRPSTIQFCRLPKKKRKIKW